MSEQPSVFSELKQLIADYLDARASLLKLEAYEKIAKVSAALFSSLIIAFLAFFLLFFLSLTAGFYLSSLFNSDALGFLLVTGFYILLLMLVIWKKKSLFENAIIDRIIEVLYHKEDDNE